MSARNLVLIRKDVSGTRHQVIPHDLVVVEQADQDSRLQGSVML